MEFNVLPGARAPYGIRNGAGPRRAVAGMVASTYVSGAESEGAYTLHMLTGAKGSGLPLLSHSEAHVTLYVLDGALELVLDGQRYRMGRGDSALVPAGTAYGFVMTRARTVLMAYATATALDSLLAGAPYDGFIPAEDDATGPADLLKGDFPGTTVLGALPEGTDFAEALTTLPETSVPYVLEAGMGERLLVADQLFTFVAGNRQTGDQYLSVMTQGPQGDMIPPHKHLLHDELFFCLDGAMRLKAGDELIELAPGDFCFVPRGTPHAYQFLRPFTNMIGWLQPGIFEPFFHTLGDPTELTRYPQTPAPFRFDRVIAKLDELDIVPLGRPPEAGA
ncbi:cupin domain-containing protein [Pseudooceanicola sp. CBS1P-1]|nr:MULTISPECIES: cupin domain-containing protein [Pseudooceanicola]MBT9383416.1 cupin domain-containing protein [Pseudooceanicola endophyticus]